jgi:hypothetical protein
MQSVPDVAAVLESAKISEENVGLARWRRKLMRLAAILELLADPLFGLEGFTLGRLAGMRRILTVCVTVIAKAKRL